MLSQSDIRELYQEVILDHNKSPRNYGELLHCTHSTHAYNPLCGDEFTVYLKIDNNIIDDIRFEGQGCAISKASASLMTIELRGKTLEQAMTLTEKFTDAVTSDCNQPIDESLGKLSVIAGVREFPVRVKCATLAWHTVIRTIKEQVLVEQQTISTQEIKLDVDSDIS